MNFKKVRGTMTNFHSNKCGNLFLGNMKVKKIKYIYLFSNFEPFFIVSHLLGPYFTVILIVACAGLLHRIMSAVTIFHRLCLSIFQWSTVVADWHAP